jgi:hypothetical protein
MVAGATLGHHCYSVGDFHTEGSVSDGGSLSENFTTLALGYP